LAFEGPLQQSLKRALLALGRLGGLSTLLPDTGLFLYGYAREGRGWCLMVAGRCLTIGFQSEGQPAMAV
jgi:hypothetical protein